MEFLDPEIEHYALKHTEEESTLLNELNRQTHLNILQPRMLSGHLQGRILSMLSQSVQPKNILEIGTYTGYSALCMAEGLLNDGVLYTIEINKELAPFAQQYFNKSPYTFPIPRFHRATEQWVRCCSTNFFCCLRREMLCSRQLCVLSCWIAVNGFPLPLSWRRRGCPTGHNISKK